MNHNYDQNVTELLLTSCIHHAIRYKLYYYHQIQIRSVCVWVYRWNKCIYFLDTAKYKYKCGHFASCH